MYFTCIVETLDGVESLDGRESLDGVESLDGPESLDGRESLDVFETLNVYGLVTIDLSTETDCVATINTSPAQDERRKPIYKLWK